MQRVLCIKEKNTGMYKLASIYFALYIFASFAASTEQISEKQREYDEKLLKNLWKFSRQIDEYSERNARPWLYRFNDVMREKNHNVALAEYIYTTNVTKENADKYADISVANKAWLVLQVKEAKQFLGNKEEKDFTSRAIYRMLKLIVAGSTASEDQQINKNIADLKNALTDIYDKTKVDGVTLDEMEELMGNETYEKRLHYWVNWREATGSRMRPLYTQLVDNLNKAARENGYPDMGEPWRIGDFGYETTNLEEMAANLFDKIKPLYRELHAFVRRHLYNKYPEAKIDLRGPIPAHILGNMWAQEWIIEDIAPYPNEPKIDITPKLESDYSVIDMFKFAEDFFTSLGLENMTDTFWAKSMMNRPADREVQCHASASDLYKVGDFRIKMCTKKNQDDLKTIHHEMGHIEYFMEYAHQPTIFRDGANAAFHEAIGDTIALSVNTPKHFLTIGLLDSYQYNDKSDLNFLLDVALKKIAFLPFGYLIDKYRWDVFSGKIDDTNYNAKWWEMRENIQGVKSPVPRDEGDFDPGAKFHVSANVPYVRYFFSFIGQFQFYEALCKKSGHTGPIHRCDYYKSDKAGELLKSMLQLGSSLPWQEAMQLMTGRPDFSADAILNYFQPLHDFLKEQNAKNNEYIGWD